MQELKHGPWQNTTSYLTQLVSIYSAGPPATGQHLPQMDPHTAVTKEENDHSLAYRPI